MLRIITIITAALLLAGCATMDTRVPQNYQKNSFYSGTRVDSDCFFDRFMCTVDMPLSLVGDTLMLPFDSWYYFETSDSNVKEEN